jgi:hypothetical protein
MIQFVFVLAVIPTIIVIVAIAPLSRVWHLESAVRTTPQTPTTVAHSLREQHSDSLRQDPSYGIPLLRRPTGLRSSPNEPALRPRAASSPPSITGRSIVGAQQEPRAHHQRRPKRSAFLVSGRPDRSGGGKEPAEGFPRKRQYWTRRTPLSDAFGYWRRYPRCGVPGVRSVWARNSTSAGSGLGGHVASRIGRRSPSSTTRYELIRASDSSSVSRISSSILRHPGSSEYPSGLLCREDHAPTTLSLSGSCE